MQDRGNKKGKTSWFSLYTLSEFLFMDSWVS